MAIKSPPPEDRISSPSSPKRLLPQHCTAPSARSAQVEATASAELDRVGKADHRWNGADIAVGRRLVRFAATELAPEVVTPAAHRAVAHARAEVTLPSDELDGARIRRTRDRLSGRVERRPCVDGGRRVGALLGRRARVGGVVGSVGRLEHDLVRAACRNGHHDRCRRSRRRGSSEQEFLRMRALIARFTSSSRGRGEEQCRRPRPKGPWAPSPRRRRGWRRPGTS